MADYTVIIEDSSMLLVDMTAAEIRDALETLPEGSRLSANYIDDMPTPGGGGTAMTGHEIVDAINLLGGAEPRILNGQIDPVPKARVLHGELCLNNIGICNPASTVIQALFSAPNTDRVKKMDFIVAYQSPTNNVYDDGDWLIALVDEPGWDYSDTDKWYVLKLHKLNEITTPVFVYQSNGSTATQPVLGGSLATGAYAHAFGQSTIASGQASTSLGKESEATRIGQVAESSGKIASIGDCQMARYTMNLVTTNAAATEMVLPARFAFETGRTYVLEVQLVARVGGTIKGTKAKEWTYKYIAGIDDSGNTYNDGGLVSESLSYGFPSLSASVLVVPSITDASGTNPPQSTYKGLEIKCTGITATTVRWAAFITSYEIEY